MLGYITERQRQVSAINIFYEKTLYQDQPQVAVYSEADIPRAMLTETYIFVLYIGVLPDLIRDNFDNYNNNNTGKAFNIILAMPSRNPTVV